LNIEQRHLGYDEGYTHGLYDGSNNIDSNYRVDESKNQYYKSGYTEGYDDGYQEAQLDMIEEEYVTNDFLIEGFLDRSFYNI